MDDGGKKTRKKIREKTKERKRLKNEWPLTSLPVNHLTATGCITSACAGKTVFKLYNLPLFLIIPKYESHKNQATSPDVMTKTTIK